MGYEYQSGPPWGIKMDFTGGILNINQDNRNINLDCTNGLISDSNWEFTFVSNGVLHCQCSQWHHVKRKQLSPAPLQLIILI